MIKKFLFALLWLGLGTSALAQQSPPPATPSSPAVAQTTPEELGYVGATTRIGVGYDDTTHLRGELYRVFTESETSSVLGEAWIASDAGGIKFSYNWLPEAWSSKSADPVVRKFFLAADRNAEGDAKVTVGGGFEKRDLFGGLYGSFGVTGRRQISDLTVATTETIQGNDGRPFLQDITTSVRTQVFERAYDYGIGARIGHFHEPWLLRLTLGADYEWGRDSASQTTGSLGVEKFFAGAPFSLALNVEHYRKSGGFEPSGSDTRLIGMLRYEFGGPVFRPARESRMVQVAPAQAAAPVPAPEPPKPVAVAPAPPPAAAPPPPPRKETRLVKTTATMLSDAFFEFDQATLTPAARSALDGVIARIKTSGFTGNIRITGHTCDIGSAAYNQGLSERRANSVRNYLTTNGGLSRDVIIAEGKGLREPRYPNTRAERYKNRRVDLEFVTYEDKVEEYMVPSPPVAAPPPPPPAPVAAAVTPPPPVPAPVEWRREVLDKEPPWLRRALRQSLPHKQTVDVYRQQDQATTVTEGDKRYINRPPVAANDAFTVAFGSVSNSFDVLANDSDPDGDALALTAVTSPQHGSATISGGRVLYTPASGFSGADSFSYSISDGKGGSASATVAITVQGAANRPPVAQNDGFTVNQDSPTNSLNVLANDSDPDGDTLTIIAVTTPAHGTFNISGNRINYTPAAGYSGSDSASYTISDGRGGTASATVTITVAPVAANRPPVAQNDAFTVDQDSANNTLNVLANDTDPDGDPLTITTVGTPSHGTATISGSAIRYTPAPGFVGTDSVTYTISDGRGGTATATVTITVRTTAANRAPLARDDTFVITQQFTDLNVLANDSDPDGDPLTIISVTPPQPPNGTLQIAAGGKSIRFTMAFGFSTTTFTYTISDGRGGTSIATVRLIDP